LIDWTPLARQVRSELEADIDQVVYGLFDLTADEREVVEAYPNGF
jgi:hypothetical protein